jgi:hypothetical protein
MGAKLNGRYERKKWYERGRAVRLLLILFYPVGIYGFIRAQRKPVVTMALTTLIYGGFRVLVVVSISSSPETVQEMHLEDSVPVKTTETENDSIDNEPLILYQAAKKSDLKMVNEPPYGKREPKVRRGILSVVLVGTDTLSDGV